MTRITNADQVLALLRVHLERVRKTRRQTQESATKRGLPALQRLRGLARASPLSEEEIERILVAGILEEEFGALIASDPKFQQVIDEVLAILRSDNDARRLIKKAMVHLSDQPEG